MEDVKVRETHINVVRFSTVELFADTFMFFILFVRNCVWKKRGKESVQESSCLLVPAEDHF